jgi:hypothetical protein
MGAGVHVGEGGIGMERSRKLTEEKKAGQGTQAAGKHGAFKHASDRDRKPKKAAGGAAKAARWCVDRTPCDLKIVLVLGFSFFGFLSRERER